MRTFSGLMSRWMTPLLCANSAASQTFIKMSRWSSVRSSLVLPRAAHISWAGFLRRSLQVTPCTRFMTRTGRPRSSMPSAWTGMTPGCSRCPVIAPSMSRASRSRSEALSFTVLIRDLPIERVLAREEDAAHAALAERAHHLEVAVVPLGPRRLDDVGLRDGAAELEGDARQGPRGERRGCVAAPLRPRRRSEDGGRGGASDRLRRVAGERLVELDFTERGRHESYRLQAPGFGRRRARGRPSKEG